MRGGAQYVAGPAIAIPYTLARSVDAADADPATFSAMFLPQELQIDGSPAPRTIARSSTSSSTTLNCT